MPDWPTWSGSAELRVDRFLWWARLAKTRQVAQAIAEAGHLRIGGRPIDRAHAAVRPGDVLVWPAHGRVRVIRIEALPTRRGPAPEARACYTDLGEPPANVSQQSAID